MINDNSQLKKGYKQTEVGVIPDDWDASDIPQVIGKANGIKIGPFGSQLKKKLYPIQISWYLIRLIE